MTPLSRRGMLAGAAALAGTGAALSSGTTAAAADADAREAGDRGHGKAVVFRDVRPLGARKAVDLTVVDGRISDRPAPKGAKVVEGGGRVALPSLVDAHIHPDKTTWGGSWVTRKPASGIADYVAQDVELFKS